MNPKLSEVMGGAPESKGPPLADVMGAAPEPTQTQNPNLQDVWNTSLPPENPLADETVDNRTFTENLSDKGNTIAKGYATLGNSLHKAGMYMDSLLGLDTLADKFLGEGATESMNNSISDTFETSEAYWENKKTDTIKRLVEERNMDYEEAEGFVEKAKVMASNPEALMDDSVAALPELLSGGTVGKVLGKGKAAMEIFFASAFGGLLEGGRTRTEIIAELEKKPDEEWEQSDEYNKLIADDVSPRAAKKYLATELGNQSGSVATLATTLTSIFPGLNVLPKAVTGNLDVATGSVVKGLVGGSLKGAASEGAQEAIAGAITDVGKNYARAEVDGTTELMDGVVEDMGGNMVAGAAMGAPVSAAGGAVSASANKSARAKAKASFVADLNKELGITTEDADLDAELVGQDDVAVDASEPVAKVEPELDIDAEVESFSSKLSEIYSTDVFEGLADPLPVDQETKQDLNKISDAQLILGEETIDPSIAENSRQEVFLKAEKARQDERIAATGIDPEQRRKEIADENKATRKANNNQNKSAQSKFDETSGNIANDILGGQQPITQRQIDEAPTREAKKALESQQRTQLQQIDDFVNKTSEEKRSELSDPKRRPFNVQPIDGKVTLGDRSYPADTTGSKNDKPPKGVANRRKDFDKRSKVAAMTPEQTYDALYTEEGTGISNGRAYAEDKSSAKEFTSIDVDSLASINDYGNHDMGDAMLVEVGKALKAEFGDQAYHKSGDEYFILDAENVGPRLEKVRADLATRVIEGDHNGNKLTVKGVDFTYGTDADATLADGKMLESKKQRTERGERTARKELPPNFIYQDANGVELSATLSAEGRIEFDGVTPESNQSGDTGIRNQAENVVNGKQVKLPNRNNSDEGIKEDNTSSKRGESEAKSSDQQSEGDVKEDDNSKSEVKGLFGKKATGVSAPGVSELLDTIRKIPDVVIKDVPPRPGMLGGYDTRTRKIYIYTSMIRDRHTLRDTIYHEGIHAGLMESFGSTKGVKNAMLNLRKNIGPADIARLKRQIGIDLSGYDLNQSDPAQLAIMIEEIVAHFGHSRNGKLGNAVWNLIDMIRKYVETKTGLEMPGGDKGRRLLMEMLRTAEVGFKARNGKSLRQLGLRPNISQALVNDNSVMERAIQRTFRATRNHLSLMWTKERGLGSHAHKLLIESDGAKKSSEDRLDSTRRKLMKAMEAQFKNVANEHYEEANKLLQGKKSEVKFSKEVVGLIKQMRNDIDLRSAGMIAALDDMIALAENRLSDTARDNYELYLLTNGLEGKLPVAIGNIMALQQKIDTNKGSYMNTSYEVFDNPNWARKVEDKLPEVYSRALSYVAQDVKKGEPTRSYAEAKSILDNMLDTMTQKGEMTAFISVGSMTGSRDMSILQKKKDIPDAIRAVMGEYKDIRVNYTKSVSKMDFHIANHNFLMNVYNDLHGDLVFDNPGVDHNGEQLFKITPNPNNKSYQPLAGLWATKLTIDALKLQNDVPNPQEWVRRLQQLNSSVKIGKTVVSVETQVANVTAGIGFVLHSGHVFDKEFYTNGMVQNAKIIGTATKNASKLFNRDGKIDTDALDNYVSDLVERGVLHEAPVATEIKRSLEEFFKMDMTTAQPWSLKKGFDNMQRMYRYGDDFWKIAGYEAEVARLMKRTRSNGSGPRVPRYTEKQARDKAAQRIRNTYPTYSMVPEAIQRLRLFPLAGTFVSFPYEIIRNSFQNVMTLKEDAGEMMDGDPEAAKDVAKRAVGAVIAHSYLAAIATASMAMFGISEEDDENFKKMQGAGYLRNNDYIYLGSDDAGNPRYIDATRYNSYAYVQSIPRTLANGSFDSAGEMLGQMTYDTLSPFLGTEIAPQAAIDLLKGTNSYGQPIFDKTDDALDVTFKSAKHMVKALTPTSLTRLANIGMVSSNNVLDTNFEVKVGGNEVSFWESIAQLFGGRIRTADISKTLGYNATDIAMSKRELPKILNRAMVNTKDADNKDLKKAVEDYMERYERVHGNLLGALNSARGFDIPDSELKVILNASGISKVDSATMVRAQNINDIPEWKYSERMGASWVQRALRDADPEEREELKRLFRARRKLIRKYIREHEKKRKQGN